VEAAVAVLTEAAPVAAAIGADLSAEPAAFASALPTFPPSHLPTPVAKHAHDMAAGYKLACPECGGTLALQEGCRKCHACGWAAC
jgi:hypothetical protein